MRDKSVVGYDHLNVAIIHGDVLAEHKRDNHFLVAQGLIHAAMRLLKDKYSRDDLFDLAVDLVKQDHKHVPILDDIQEVNTGSMDARHDFLEGLFEILGDLIASLEDDYGMTESDQNMVKSLDEVWMHLYKKLKMYKHAELHDIYFDRDNEVTIFAKCDGVEGLEKLSTTTYDVGDGGMGFDGEDDQEMV